MLIKAMLPASSIMLRDEDLIKEPMERFTHKASKKEAEEALLSMASAREPRAVGKGREETPRA